jgi:hypothetical protein
LGGKVKYVQVLDSGIGSIKAVISDKNRNNENSFLDGLTVQARALKILPKMEERKD